MNVTLKSLHSTLLLSLGLSVSFLSSSAFAEIRSSQPVFFNHEATRTVEYYGKVKVTVPEHITRVASAWEAQNSILVMLGAGNKIVATTRIAKSIPAFSEIVPSIRHAALSTMGSGRDINVEALIKLHPDILFVPEGIAKAKQKQLEDAGIAVASFHDNSIQSLVERVVITGKLLGPDAYKKALKYQAYFKQNEQLVASRLKTIPASQRVNVYLSSGMPLMTGGRPSLNQDWMDLSGAVNVAENWHIGKAHWGSANSDIESVIAANPDVIVAMNAKDANTIEHSPKWHAIKAVQTHRVYTVPRGLFFWSRETSEEALQFVWMAKQLYPQHFKDINMMKMTKQFYHTFYNTDFSDKEINGFLHPTAFNHAGFDSAKQH